MEKQYSIHDTYFALFLSFAAYDCLQFRNGSQSEEMQATTISRDWLEF